MYNLARILILLGVKVLCLFAFELCAQKHTFKVVVTMAEVEKFGQGEVVHESPLLTLTNELSGMLSDWELIKEGSGADASHLPVNVELVTGTKKFEGGKWVSIVEGGYRYHLNISELLSFSSKADFSDIKFDSKRETINLSKLPKSVFKWKFRSATVVGRSYHVWLVESEALKSIGDRITNRIYEDHFEVLAVELKLAVLGVKAFSGYYKPDLKVAGMYLVLDNRQGKLIIQNPEQKIHFQENVVIHESQSNNNARHIKFGMPVSRLLEPWGELNDSVCSQNVSENKQCVSKDGQGSWVGTLTAQSFTDVLLGDGASSNPEVFKLSLRLK